MLFCVPENLLDPPLGCQDMELTAVSIVGSPYHQKIQRQLRKKVPKPLQSGSSVLVRPCLVGGISVSPSAVPARRTNLDLVWGGSSDVISSPMVQAMNDVNEASNRESAALDIMKVREGESSGSNGHMPSNQAVMADRKKSLFLVVYDFHYHNPTKDECVDSKNDAGSGGKCNAGQTGNSAKKVVSGTGTSAACSGTRQENNNMYQEILLSKLFYDPIIEDVDTDIVMAPPPECLVDGLEFPAASSSGGVYPPPNAVAVPAGAGGTYDASPVSVTFPSINGGITMSNFPSTSDGSPPMVMKVSRVLKKDSCGSNKTSVDSVSSCHLMKPCDPVVVQCVALPDVYKERRNLSIFGIHPTKDGGHLLVVLGSANCDREKTCNLVSGHGSVRSAAVNSNCEGNMLFGCSDNDSDMDIDVDDVVGNVGLAMNTKHTSVARGKSVEQFRSRQNFGFCHDSDIFQEGLKMLDNSECKRTDILMCKGSVLLVYALDFEGEVVKLCETPVKVRDIGVCGECPVEVTLLPLLEKEDNGDSSNNLLTPVKGCPLGLAVLVGRDGVVRIVDVATLKTVSQAVPERKGTKFVSAAYCNSE